MQYHYKMTLQPLQFGAQAHLAAATEAGKPRTECMFVSNPHRQALFVKDTRRKDSDEASVDQLASAHLTYF